jgi:hypothetical protein
MLELPHNPTIAAVGGFPKFVWDRMWGFLFWDHFNRNFTMRDNAAVFLIHQRERAFSQPQSKRIKPIVNLP